MPVTEEPGQDWDASTYDELPLPHERWGAELLSRMQFSGDEHVLDAGCGTGRDTALLLDQLPRGHVTAVDASATMLSRLRERLAGHTDRLTVFQADLSSPLLDLARPVTAVFSVATLHWVPDHAKVFRNLAAVTAPGAQLAFECGGHGNIRTVLDAVHRATGDDSAKIGWNFARPVETERLLVENGFVDVQARLRDAPARLAATELHDYLRTVILGRHLAPLAPEERSRFVDAVAAVMPEPVIDYVRLEVTARRK